MSRALRVTEEHLKNMFKEFANYLKTASTPDGKIEFIRTIGTLDRKAELRFSEVAWLKMQSLIREFDKEVAWHGTAWRDEDESKDVYHIGDILVYPQEVSGATVNTDQEKYQSWLYDLDDEEFNNIRMQGHSHVNMSTSPSSVDLTHQASILEQLEEDMFYIFLIWNKKGERNIKIYDMKKNILFESSDVTVTVENNIFGIEHFMQEAKELVKTKSYASAGSQYPYVYKNSTYAAAQQKPTDQKKPENTGTPAKKKGHRKQEQKKAPANACSSDYADEEYYRQQGMYGYYDDNTNPYSAFGYR